METNQSDKSNNEPKAKRPKMNTEASSTSSKSKATDDYSPISTLPLDILAKIIAKVPVARWPALELMNENFRAATWIAWRQLRCFDVDRELLIKPENKIDRTSIGENVPSVELILRKLVERSPFMTSICGMDIRSIDAELYSNAIRSLAQFEHLQSVSLGDTKFTDIANDEMPLELVVEFLESTRSRASLKELQLYNVVQRRAADRTTILERFAASFVTGREILSPLKLEKFSFASFDRSLRIRLDTVDTTRLADLRLANATIDPDQLSNLIERAPNLRRIEVSFLKCGGRCKGPRLRANKTLLAALATRENLTAIKLDSSPECNDDNKCMDFKLEYIEMLETIGRRGQLKELSLDNRMLPFVVGVDDEVCAAICKYLPYLRSIKLSVSYKSRVNFAVLASLTELEDINIQPYSITANAVEKIAQLPLLKRLAIDGQVAEKTKLIGLADASSLVDLRIQCAGFIRAEDFDKWSVGFASNLKILMLDRVCLENKRDEEGLIRLLKKAVRLRVLVLEGCITDRSLMAIARSCPELETFGVSSVSLAITAHHLQKIVDRCPKLKRLDGFEEEIRNKLRFPKYRKFGAVNVDYADMEYD